MLADPRVVAAQGAVVAREGCLSIPDLTANVRRATQVTVGGHDATGAPVSVDAEGFEARCLLHEIDHLDGILFWTGWIRSPPTCSGASATAEGWSCGVRPLGRPDAVRVA